MLDVTDIAPGLPGVVSPRNAPGAAPETGLPPVVPDSGTARALFHVWRGQPVVVLDAPPGSGKTTGVVTILAHLVRRAGLGVVLACPTRAQAAAVAERLVDVLPEGTLELAMSGPVGGVSLRVASAVIQANRKGAGFVKVVTVASASRSQPSADLMVVDEAYQATFADVAVAAANVPQLLLVGDPGQIGPVVTVDTSAFEHVRDAPHRRSPHVFARRDNARTFNLDTTYRLGPVSAGIIAPLYRFRFVSARIGRSVTVGGSVVPEVARIDVGVPVSEDDVSLMAAVADRAELLASGVEIVDEAGRRGSVPGDVAVVVARNSQVSTVSAMLSARGLPGVTVGTADRLQGGQWPLVVALDPLAGAGSATGHTVSPGRTCVAVSRHSAHLTWVHASNWEALLAGSDLGPAEVRGAVEVRRLLSGQPAV